MTRAKQPAAERLIREWSRDKVRVRNRDGYWWCWDSGGYTADMAQAGLYEADWKPSSGRSDEVVPVDPEKWPIDAIMARLEEEEEGARIELHQIRLALHDGTSEDAYSAAVKWKERAEKAESDVVALREGKGVPVAELAAALRERILDLVVDDAKTFAMLVIVADEIAELAGIPTPEFSREPKGGT